MMDSHPAAAVADLEFAYQCAYDIAVACSYLGDVMALAGNATLAERLYRKALSVDPASVAALVGLADRLRARGDLDGAAELMMKAALLLRAGGRANEAAYWERVADEARHGN
jgi:Flp pilus assembly protein TadD